MESPSKLERWQQKGQICLWRFNVLPHHTFSGWHFSADNEGCDSLLELLTLFSDAEHPSYRTIKLVDASAASKVVGVSNVTIVYPNRLRLLYEPAGQDVCTIRREDDLLSIVLGPIWLGELVASVAKVRVRGGDFSIDWTDEVTGKDRAFWFWWWVGGNAR